MISEILNYAVPHSLNDLLGLSVKLQSSARCHVRINGNTVIATELSDNPGMSLTNAAASAAMQVCYYYEIPLKELIWIEHYPEELDQEETFDLVQFSNYDSLLTFEGWQRLSVEETERLFGHSVERKMNDST